MNDFKGIEANSPMSPMNTHVHVSEIEKYFGKNENIEVPVHGRNSLGSLRATFGKRRIGSGGGSTKRANLHGGSLIKRGLGSLTDPQRKTSNNIDDLSNFNNFFRYFLVELIDPQVNFLDDKSHSSLIIVAGYHYDRCHHHHYYYHY